MHADAGLIRLVVLDIWKHIGPAGSGLFPPARARRRFGGATLEEVIKDREARLPAFRASLDPLRRTVERQKFVCGDAPAYADYIVFGAFQWARAISDFALVTADDPVHAWRGRMLDLFWRPGRASRQATAANPWATAPRACTLRSR